MITESDYPVWNGYLYQLQEEAPRPKAVLSNNSEAAIGRPHYFGDECHGLISREEGDVLCSEEGNFLIRESQKERGRYTLVIRILGTTKNFKLYWEDGQHFVGEKRFNDIYALVGDGLITMYVEEKARDYIQNMSNDRSVYSSLSRTRQLLTRQLPNRGPIDPRQSPRRAQSVRAQSFDNSPRHAHNGKNTETAALPYTYYQNHAVENDPDCTGLEDKMVATHMMPDDRFFVQNTAYHTGQQGSSMLQSLMSIKGEGQGNYISYQNGGLRNETNGGNKKSLTPTSSDERKRPRAKKVATEECITQQSYDYQEYSQQNIPKFAHGTTGISNYELSRTSSSGSNTDSGGRRRYPKPNVPVHLQNRPFHQSVPSSSSPTRSPMHRNNSDPTKPQTASYQYSMPSQHTHTNVAHVRQLGGVLVNNKAALDHNSQGTVNGSGGLLFENQGSEERIMLDANDNQMYLSVSQQSNTKGYHSPSRSRQSPRQPNFDSSSGSEVIPATTFHQLKMFQRRLEEASEDDIHNEAKDEVTTLRGHPKASVRLTRSHTTVGMAPVVRPHSGKSTPKPAPRDVHFRQRSEPVELYQHHSQRKAGGQQFFHGDVRQQGYPVRAKDQYLLPPEQNLASDLRSGSGGSCNSSLSNVSSVGQHSFHRPLDSLSHLSSEEWTGEERESSPSPQSTGHRSCSSDDSGGLKTRDFKPHLTRQNTVISAEVTWQQRLAEERGNYIRGVECEKDESSSQIHVKSVCVPPPESLNAPKPRRKSSDFETSTRSKSQSNKSRHHSETSSEEGTPRHHIAPLHKPLQRRATTGGSPSANKNAVKQNGVMSPIKESKKLAHRSNSGPSPRKGKKSPECPMSPRTQHIHHQRSLSSPRNENVPYYDKEHVFKSHTYRGLQWCEYCGNFMWGIIQQGMQCRDCGLNVHKQCSKLVPGDCQPALKHVKTVFGIDLTALVKLHGTERPIVVDKCIEEIEKRGMDSEGIYRVSGFHDDVQELKLNFDRFGSEVDLSSYEDINIVAGGLKLYLRELPVPLIPYNLYSRFINAAKLAFTDGKLEAIKTAIDMMPLAHLQTLKHIVQHLSRVCDREANHMTSKNLSIVFGPTMLRPPEKSTPSRYSLNDTQYQQEIVQTIIENRTDLFGIHKDNMTIRETPIL